MRDFYMTDAELEAAARRQADLLAAARKLADGEPGMTCSTAMVKAVVVALRIAERERDMARAEATNAR